MVNGFSCLPVDFFIPILVHYIITYRLLHIVFHIYMAPLLHCTALSYTAWCETIFGATLHFYFTIFQILRWANALWCLNWLVQFCNFYTFNAIEARFTNAIMTMTMQCYCCRRFSKIKIMYAKLMKNRHFVACSYLSLEGAKLWCGLSHPISKIWPYRCILWYLCVLVGR